MARPPTPRFHGVEWNGAGTGSGSHGKSMRGILCPMDETRDWVSNGKDTYSCHQVEEEGTQYLHRPILLKPRPDVGHLDTETQDRDKFPVHRVGRDWGSLWITTYSQGCRYFNYLPAITLLWSYEDSSGSSVCIITLTDGFPFVHTCLSRCVMDMPISPRLANVQA